MSDEPITELKFLRKLQRLLAEGDFVWRGVLGAGAASGVDSLRRVAEPRPPDYPPR